MHSSQAQQAFHIASGLEDIAAAQCCYHHGYNNTALKKQKNPERVFQRRRVSLHCLGEISFYFQCQRLYVSVTRRYDREISSHYL